MRQAVAGDAGALAALRWDMHIEEELATTERALFDERMRAFVRASLDSGRWAIWVAEDDGDLVATVYVHVVERVPRPAKQSPWGYVTSVYTRADRRNEGVGSELLTAVVEWARREDLGMLLVWPSERSVPFYERAGFTPSPEARELHLA